MCSLFALLNDTGPCSISDIRDAGGATGDAVDVIALRWQSQHSEGVSIQLPLAVIVQAILLRLSERFRVVILVGWARCLLLWSPVSLAVAVLVSSLTPDAHFIGPVQQCQPGAALYQASLLLQGWLSGLE